MPQPREHPYIWAPGSPDCSPARPTVSGPAGSAPITRTGSGRPSEFDNAKWMLDHTALLNREREKQRIPGFRRLCGKPELLPPQGRHATLAGEPYLIAVKYWNAAIIDAKTGRLSPHHAVQVMLYQYAVPKALTKYQGIRVRGQVGYSKSNVGIPASRIDRNFVDNLGALIRRLAADTPARRVPRFAECRLCDLTESDCPERVEGEVLSEMATTDDF